MTTLYARTVPYWRRALANAVHFLGKSRTHFAATGIHGAEIARWRLAPDMFDLGRQIVVATDGVRGAAARLAGRVIEPADDPAFAVFNRGGDQVFHEPATLADAIAYARAGVAFLDAVDPASFSGAERRPILLTMAGETRRFSVEPFVGAYVPPNLYFHLSMAYAMLRARGAPIGKADYEGADVYDLG